MLRMNGAASTWSRDTTRQELPKLRENSWERICQGVIYKLHVENVTEIRHYVSRAGKDLFDDWLTQLADPRAQAKIATRINRLAAGN